MPHLPVAFLGLILFVSPLHALHGVMKLPIWEDTFVVEISQSNPSKTVTLKCNAPENEEVYWSRNENGIITVREEPDGGQYTCYFQKNGTEVNSISVLINDKSSTLLSLEQPIQCEAKNYSGHFNCSWTSSLDIQHHFHAERGLSNIHCDHPVQHNSVYSVRCHDTQTCEFEEEQQQIRVELHVKTETKYEKHVSMFVLRDIIKPDPPINLSISGNVLKWSYPKTWCNVHSYFPLIFKVNYTSNHNREKIEQVDQTSLTIKSKPNQKHPLNFCVQARDMFYKSSWSNQACSCRGHKKEKKNKQLNKTKKQKRKRHM
ncbi:interleukin-12 subunit beta [Discoglossus pictus]